MQLVAHGLYTVKDRYFTEFGNGYWVDNLGTDTGLTISRKEGRTIICFKIPTVWIG